MSLFFPEVTVYLSFSLSIIFGVCIFVLTHAFLSSSHWLTHFQLVDTIRARLISQSSSCMNPFVYHRSRPHFSNLTIHPSLALNTRSGKWKMKAAVGKYKTMANTRLSALPILFGYPFLPKVLMPLLPVVVQLQQRTLSP